jgi:hypothetical protein
MKSLDEWKSCLLGVKTNEEDQGGSDSARNTSSEEPSNELEGTSESSSFISFVEAAVAVADSMQQMSKLLY